MTKRNYTYVVRTCNGFYEAKNKKDAVEYFNSINNANDIIKSYSKTKNYFHNRVNIVLS